MSPLDPPAPQDNAERWREAVLTAGLAVFDWDVPAKRIWRSPEMLATWDYPEGPNEAVDGARAVIHPDDFPAFWSRMMEVEGTAVSSAPRSRSGCARATAPGDGCAGAPASWRAATTAAPRASSAP